MEKQNQLPSRVEHQKQEISLIRCDPKIVKAIGEVNKCIPFPLEASELISWGNDVARLQPEATPAKLAFLMDAFKTEELLWDKSLGIQNIFRGLKRVSEENGKFKILNWPG